MFFFSSYMETLKEKKTNNYIYSCSACHMRGLPEHGNLCKHQSNSTIWVFRRLKWTCHIVTFCVQDSSSKLNRCLMSRGFFDSLDIQLALTVMDDVFTEGFQSHVLKHHESRPLHGVYRRLLLGTWCSEAPWQTGEALSLRGQCVLVLMWLLLVFCVPAKT